MASIDPNTSRIFSILEKGTLREPAKQGVLAYKHSWIGFILSLLGYSVAYKDGDTTRYVNKSSLTRFIDRYLGYSKASELKTIQLEKFLGKCVASCASTRLDVERALVESVQTSKRLGAAVGADYVVGTEEAIRTLLGRLSDFSIHVKYENLPITDIGTVDILERSCLGENIKYAKVPLYKISDTDLLRECTKTIDFDVGIKIVSRKLNGRVYDQDPQIRKFVGRVLDEAKQENLKFSEWTDKVVASDLHNTFSRTRFLPCSFAS